MARLSEEQLSFIRDNPYPAVVTTLRRDGTPHSTVVWIDEQDGDLLFNTREPRAKPRELRSNPNVAALVLDPNDPYHWVSVSGTTSFETEGAAEHIDKLSLKYEGRPYEFFEGEEQKRIIVRIHADKVDSSGFD
jgi:PPOX class probable F420-dependent enzyme